MINWNVNNIIYVKKINKVRIALIILTSVPAVQLSGLLWYTYIYVYSETTLVRKLVRQFNLLAIIGRSVPYNIIR